MRYRNRMILLYMIFVFVLALIIGTVYYNYNNVRLREREQQSLRFRAQEVMQHFDASVEMLDYAIKTLAYNADVIDAMRFCADAGRNPDYPEEYYLNAIRTLNNNLYTGPLENFYRIIIFNRFGDVAANRGNGRYGIDKNVTWSDLPWLESVEDKGGRSVLIGLHEDDWGGQERPIVYSYVKELQGEDLGYIEVQQERAHLEEILRVPDDGMQIYLFDPEGRFMFASEQEADEDALYELAQHVIVNGEAGAKMAAAERSSFTGAIALAVLPNPVLASENRDLLMSTFVVVAGFALASLAFVYLISSYLTKPIERMQKIIARTQIENIGQSVVSEAEYKKMHSTLEVRQLMETYEGMTKRLSMAIEAERTTARLYMNSQFDALQAQVNPHFLFNILNVVSLHGMAYEDDTICEICANLAAILRYSTNMKQRLATLDEELKYLSQYAYLQKCRYQDKFEYSCDVDADVLQIEIPRLTIQQLVENCMHHGYQDTAEEMCIYVAAKREGNACVISVHDCGTGFPDEKINVLYEEFAQMRSDMYLKRKAPDMEIGGMGLINVYARLYLTFGERFDIELLNDEGATVRIVIYDAQ